MRPWEAKFLTKEEDSPSHSFLSFSVRPEEAKEEGKRATTWGRGGGTGRGGSGAPTPTPAPYPPLPVPTPPRKLPWLGAGTAVSCGCLAEEDTLRTPRHPRPP